MRVEISVPEVVEMFKEIQAQPKKLFEMIRGEVRQTGGHYLSEMMGMELTPFLGREPYERGHGEVNHRNGSSARSFTLKGIGEVQGEVPREIGSGSSRPKLFPEVSPMRMRSGKI